MKSEIFRELLSPLGAPAMQRIAFQFGVKSRRKQECLDAIVTQHAASPAPVLAAMRREDLYLCLRAWVFENPSGTFALLKISSARLADLHACAQRIWVEGWQPARDGEAVVPGGPITVQRWDDDDDPWAEISPPPLPSLPSTLAEDELSSDHLSLETIRLGNPPPRPAGKALANFQSDAVTWLRERLRSSRTNALLCLPTGGGKTRTAMHLVLNDYIARNHKVLWVTHRVDLLDQAGAEIREAAHEIATRRTEIRISRAYRGTSDVSGDFVLASSMTLVRNDDLQNRLRGDPELKLVVYDEAHRLGADGTLKAIKSILDKRRPILGLTATPYRRDDRETRTLRKFFHSETYNISFAQLVTQRFLAWPVFVHWRMNSTKSFTLTELENLQLQRSGDYSAKTLERLGRIHNRDAEIARHFRTNAAVYKKTIAFACSIEHAEQLAKVLSHHRVSAKPIHSDLSTDARTSILNEFRSGSIQVLVNVGLLTEGTNVPETTTVLLARPTRSRSLYMQMIGRAARGHRAVPGKEKFYVIDCVDNFYSNGFSGFSEEIYQELNEAQALPRRETHEEADPPHDLRVRTTPGVTEALLHLLALGFEPRAYHFWGELQWTSPSTGARRGACVFLETRDLIKRAIQRLDVVRATGRQDLVEADARELDESGALRRDDWLDAWAGYRDRQVLPVLVEAADITAEAGVMSLVERIDQAVIVHPDWTLQEWQAYLDQQDDFREALLRAFGDLPSALQALLRHGHDRAEPESPEEIHPTIQTRSFVQDAEDFTLLACALLAPSNVPAPETQIIRHSCDALFGVEAPLHVSLPVVSDETLLARAARLGEGVSYDRGSEVLDHLLRVVLSDARVTLRERHVLALTAPFLGVSAEELAERLDAIESSLAQPPAAHAAPEEYTDWLTCRVCDQLLPLDSSFCGACGAPVQPVERPTIDTPLEAGQTSTSTSRTSSPPAAAAIPGASITPTPASPPAHVSPPSTIPCPGCGTLWEADARFCGTCGRAFTRSPAADPSPMGTPSAGVEGRETTADAPATPRTPSGSRSSREGYRAEQWLLLQLKEHFSDVTQDDASQYVGQSDFVVRWNGNEYHIELKHVSMDSDEFHLSRRQTELCEKLQTLGHQHALVIARRIVSSPADDYDLYWCLDMLKVFHSAPKRVERHYRFTVPEHDPQAPGWPTPDGVPDLDSAAIDVHYHVKLDRSTLERLHKIGPGEVKVGPVLAWRNGLEKQR